MACRLLLCAGLIFVATGCPAQIDVAAAKPAPPAKLAEATEADPRVARDGEDLYPAKTLERRDALRGEAGDSAGDSDGESPTAALGSGRPDETNGVCRLYAPKLPEPECCVANLGFDVKVVTEACGLGVYLGESFQASCGHYFHEPNGGTVWMRISNIAAADVTEAVTNHYRQAPMRGAAPPTEVVPGVKRSNHQGYNWAFMPGLDGAGSVRMLSWKDGTCSDAGLKTVLEKLVAAKKPPKGAARSLVPTAQY